MTNDVTENFVITEIIEQVAKRSANTPFGGNVPFNMIVINIYLLENLTYYL